MVALEGCASLPASSQVQGLFDHFRVPLKLAFPKSDRTIEAVGKVAWTYDIKKGSSRIFPGMGIKFTKMPPKERAFLEEYLQKLSSASPPVQ